MTIEGRSVYFILFYYSKRIQIKISQGERYMEQSPGWGLPTFALHGVTDSLTPSMYDDAHEVWFEPLELLMSRVFTGTQSHTVTIVDR